MNTQNLITATLIAATLGSAAGGTHARDGNRQGGYYDDAQVVQVRPVREIVRVAQPQQECWSEAVRYPEPGGADAGAYMVTGTLIGGVLGNQAVRGKGRRAATVAGTVAGAMVGNSIGQRQQQGYGYGHIVQEQRCRTSERWYEEERNAGYEVTYRYQGREFTRMMDYDPGSRVRVWVDVAVAG